MYSDGSLTGALSGLCNSSTQLPSRTSVKAIVVMMIVFRRCDLVGGESLVGGGGGEWSGVEADNVC